MSKRGAIILMMALILLPTGCSIKPGREELLNSMVEKIARINSYQLEAEMEIDGERFLLRQWFSAPDRLRTVVNQGTGLEQIIVSSAGDTFAFYSATRQWVVLPEPDSGPFPWGQPIVLFLGEMAQSEASLTETFSTIKVSVQGLMGWEYCEVVISERSRLPESCTLTKGNHEVKLHILSLVTNMRFSEELFQPGR